jgi:hypothetical protein
MVRVIDLPASKSLSVSSSSIKKSIIMSLRGVVVRAANSKLKIT